MTPKKLIWILFIVDVTVHLGAQQITPTDREIKQKIIQESIANYPGNCPCPYNKDRAGRSCGRRSAYSRPGGHQPVCYEQDVTPKMIENYRERQGKRPKA